eukprot:5657883-Ditylum_brightwellii.AAC.1
MAEQIKAGHIVILPISSIHSLPNLTISPADLIPQPGRRPRLIYDYTAGAINPNVHLSAPAEAL